CNAMPSGKLSRIPGTILARWGPRNDHPPQPSKSGKATRGSGGAADLSCGRNSTAVSAGLRVNELNVEIKVDTEIVSANLRKNCPVIPVMKAHGMNTALSTRPTAI